MPFDGIPYADGSIIHPHLYRPGAPLSGQLFSRALRSAYFLARYQSRLLFQQDYAFNSRLAASYSALPGFVLSSSTYGMVADVECFVPEEATHLRAIVKYGVIALAGAVVQTRLIADGGSTHTGVAVEIETGGQIAETGMQQFTGVFGQASDWSPQSMVQAKVQDVDIEVAIPLLAPDVCRLSVEMKRTTTFTATIKPLHISCWWEVRD